jgi:hypothetical protein
LFPLELSSFALVLSFSCVLLPGLRGIAFLMALKLEQNCDKRSGVSFVSKHVFQFVVTSS